MSEDKSNFTKLKVDEILTKLRITADRKETVKLWTKGNDFVEYRLADTFVEKVSGVQKVHLYFFSEGPAFDKEFLESRTYLSFSFNDVYYFTEGTAIQDDESDRIVLTIDGDVYRSEKRDSERLITFPHYQTYAYFKIIQKEKHDNVISINKNDEQEYLDYKKKKADDLRKKLEKKVDNIENLVGFRALDISKNGIAFLVDEAEGIHFKENKKMNFYILFEEKIYMVKNATLVYKVDYLGATSGAKRLKVGLTYDVIENLDILISSIIEKSMESDIIQRDFEDFLDD